MVSLINFFHARSTNQRLMQGWFPDDPESKRMPMASVAEP